MSITTETGDLIRRQIKKRIKNWTNLSIRNATRRHVAITVAIEVAQEMFGIDIGNIVADVADDAASWALGRVTGDESPVVGAARKGWAQGFEQAVFELTSAAVEAAVDVQEGRASLRDVLGRFSLPVRPLHELLPPKVPAAAGGVRAFAEAMSRLINIPASSIEDFYLSQ